MNNTPDIDKVKLTNFLSQVQSDVNLFGTKNGIDDLVEDLQTPAGQSRFARLVIDAIDRKQLSEDAEVSLINALAAAMGKPGVTQIDVVPNALMKAVSAGNLADVSKAIEEGADISRSPGLVFPDWFIQAREKHGEAELVRFKGNVERLTSILSAGQSDRNNKQNPAPG